MPRRKWIDKNNAQHFKLLYRSQDDPLLNDESTGERALFSISDHGSSAQPQKLDARGLHLADLEDDLDFDTMRENEGEAAEHGIYFDDTNYDYMQHLRDLNEGEGESQFVEAVPAKVKGKGKPKIMRLEDALREVNLDDDDEAPSLVQGSVYGDGISTFSRSTIDRTIQRQQDVPDEIAGFQPGMDSRLREVLEALDDDAFVDDEDEEDIFGELAKEGKAYGELDLDEFGAIAEDDEGWESDVTEKAPEQPREMSSPAEALPQSKFQSAEDMFEAGPETVPAKAIAQDGDWLRDFAKYKQDAKPQAIPKVADSMIGSAVQDRAPTLYTLNGTPLRQKKRKGALTNPSAYSMTSSSLARTADQQFADARFEQVEKMYAVDEGDERDEIEGGMSVVSGMTGMSKQSKTSQLSITSFADESAVRQDLDSMMDDFLGDWNGGRPTGGKRNGAKNKRGKNGNEIFGLRELDEVRAELGPARVSKSYQTAQKT